MTAVATPTPIVGPARIAVVFREDFSNPPKAFLTLKRKFPQWFRLPPSPPEGDTSWPDRRDPATASTYSWNAGVVPAPPQAVFDALLRPWETQDYYANCRYLPSRGDDGIREPLRQGSTFRWRTFGLKQRSEVLEFDPPRLVTWDAKCPGVHTLHRWILQPHPQGTYVVTEEVQRGLVAFLFSPLLKRGVHATHQLWLTTLAAHMAERPMVKLMDPDVEARPQAEGVTAAG